VDYLESEGVRFKNIRLSLKGDRVLKSIGVGTGFAAGGLETELRSRLFLDLNLSSGGIAARAENANERSSGDEQGERSQDDGAAADKYAQQVVDRKFLLGRLRMRDVYGSV